MDKIRERREIEELRRNYRPLSQTNMPEHLRDRVTGMFKEHQQGEIHTEQHVPKQIPSLDEVSNRFRTGNKFGRRFGSKSSRNAFATGGAVLAGVALTTIAIIVGIQHQAPPLQKSSLTTPAQAAQIDRAMTKADHLIRNQRLVKEFASSYSPQHKLISMRMLVDGKISETQAKDLVNQYLADIASSVPDNQLSPLQFLRPYHFHFEIVDMKDKIDPLFYGSKNAYSTQVNWNKAPTRPMLNVTEPLIPGSYVRIEGWVAKGIKGLSVTTETSIQTFTAQDNGYFTANVFVPNSLSQGTTQIVLRSNSGVVLKKTVSVANPYDPPYVIAAEGGIINHNHVNITQIRISQVKQINSNEWFVLYKIKNNGQWTPLPSNGSFGVSVIKQASGEYTTNFVHYTSLH